MLEWLSRLLSPPPTFREAGERWLASRAERWVPVVRYYNRQLFERHVYPVFGRTRIDRVSVAQVREMILGYERQAPTQARRLLQKIARVFDYAIASGWCRYNPTAGLVTVLRPPVRSAGFAFAPVKDIPALMCSLSEHPVANRAAETAFWLIAYTAVRRGEAAFARLDEFDLADGLWTIPAARMKMRREHLVPLAPQVAALLSGWLAYREQVGITGDRMFGELQGWMILDVLTKARWRGRMTIHGWRKVFSTHAHESGLWPVDAIEMQLAHIIGGVRGVYNKALLLPERRKLMAWYADEIDKWRCLSVYKGITMYRIYVLKQRKSGSEVLTNTRTQTNSFSAACAAFWELYQQPFDAKHLLLMSKDGQQINAYRYQSQPGDRDYLAINSELVE